MDWQGWESGMSVRLLGVARERRFSPGEYAAADAEILALTEAALECAGYHAAIIQPECLSARFSPELRLVFSMCQSLEALAVLQQWERQGVLVLNTPAAVLSCYHQALVETLSQAALPFPPRVVIPLEETGTVRQACHALPNNAVGWWIKRGEVHAVQPDDVVFVSQAAGCPEQLMRLRRRGIRHAVGQKHIDGHKIKFYAVRGHGLLHYVAPHGEVASPIDRERLQALVVQAGELLDLDVYGGDCILTPNDELYLVNVNDWPSFRGCRLQAAEHIARHLLGQARHRGLL